MRGMNYLSSPHSSPASVVALSFDLARAIPTQGKPAPAPHQVYDLGSLDDNLSPNSAVFDPASGTGYLEAYDDDGVFGYRRSFYGGIGYAPLYLGGDRPDPVYDEFDVRAFSRR